MQFANIILPKFVYNKAHYIVSYIGMNIWKGHINLKDVATPLSWCEYVP